MIYLIYMQFNILILQILLNQKEKRMNITGPLPVLKETIILHLILSSHNLKMALNSPTLNKMKTALIQPKDIGA